MFKIIDNPKDKSLKTIVIGTDVNDERQYAIRLLSPMLGFKLGLGVAKLLAGCFDAVKDKDIEQADQAKIISLIVHAISHADTEQYLHLLNQTLVNTYCAVKYKNQTVTLANENDLDRWFDDHRGDMLPFSGACLWLNAAPFLPATFQKALQNFKIEYLSNSEKTS